MAPATRSNKTLEGALVHVLDNILLAGADSPIRAALKSAGATEITDLLSLTMEQLAGLQWIIDEQPHKLTIAEINKLIEVQNWYKAQTEPTLDTWFGLTNAAFQTYRLTAPTAAAPTGTPAAAPAATAANDDTDLETMYFKNTKRSISDYQLKLKESKHWVNYSQQLIATAHAHGIANVFVPTYTPTTDSEKRIFKHAQEFAFSVLTGTVLEPDSQTILRKYSTRGTDLYGNAQLLYADLVQKFEGGTSAFLLAKQTEKAIHGMVLAPNNNGTITNFLTSLKHKLLDFDNYRSEPATDAWKCERLDSALLLHPRMNEHVTALQTQAEIFRDQLGDKYMAMTFDAYYAALYNYAMKLDTQTRDLNQRSR